MIWKQLFIAGILYAGGITTTQAQSAAFLNTVSDARLVALGNTGVASFETAFATQYNSAGMLFSTAESRIALSYMNLQPDYQKSSWFNAGGFYKISPKAGIGAGLRYLSGEAVRQTDGYGNNLGSITPKEYAIDLGMAYGVTKDLSVGVTLRFIGSDIGEKGTAFAADLTAMYRKERWSAGAGISNLGSKIDYGNGKYALPARLKAGASFRVIRTDRHTLCGNGEIAYQLMPADFTGLTAGLGAGYSFKQMLSLRAGYQWGEEEKTGPGFATVGGGVAWRMLNMDVAYLIAENAFKNSWFLSLGWKIK